MTKSARFEVTSLTTRGRPCQDHARAGDFGGVGPWDVRGRVIAARIGARPDRPRVPTSWKLRPLVRWLGPALIVVLIGLVLVLLIVEERGIGRAAPGLATAAALAQVASVWFYVWTSECPGDSGGS
jgi:hypothetical protein